MVNRRDFLKSASLLTLGALAACNSKGAAADGAAAAAAAPGSKNLGLQLYSLGGEFFADPAGSLKKLKEYGYNQLELAYYNNGQFAAWGGGTAPVTAADFKKMADDAGLKIASSHLTPNNVERGAKYDASNREAILDFWKGIIDDHKMFGCDYIVQPSLPSIDNLEDAQNVAETFNKVGELLAASGIKFGYHNHSNEFNKVIPGGKAAIPYYQRGFRRPDDTTPEPVTIEQVFIENTDPKNVLIELDCYWTVMGQQDPIAWITKYADRIKLLHIKDFIVIGASGAMNFENIFNAFYKNGYNDWFVEIEGTNSGLQLDRAKASAEYLLSRDFVK